MKKKEFPIYSQIKPSFEQKFYQFFKGILKPFGVNERIDMYFKLEKFSRLLHPMHFNQTSIDEDAKKAFLKSQLVELQIETHAYCNRTCNFCPNSFVDRLDKHQVMDSKIYERIINELSAIDFTGTINFHRYNEPLSNDLIFDRIAYARKLLPKAKLGFNSNGDFLTMAKLIRLEEVGTNFIGISLYINYRNDEKNHKAFAKEQMERFFNKLGASFIPLSTSDALVSARILTSKIDAIVFVPDIRHKGNDRGGSLKQFSHNIRHSPCVSPFGRLFIDWSGDVLPCCNLRGDIAEHKSSILGNVQHQSLMDIYYSEVSNQLRYYLADVSPKGGVCKTCQYDCFSSGPLSKHLMQKVLKKVLN